MLLLILHLQSLFNVSEISSAQVVDDSQFLTVADIVESEYLTKYTNKFKTYEEVRKSAGFTLDGTIDAETINNSTGEGHKGIKVNNVDEYAALLFYLKDQDGQTQTVKLNGPVKPKPGVVTPFATKTFEKVVASALTQTVMGYVTVTYDNGKISKAVTSSELIGFHPMNTWKHNSDRSYVDLNSKKTGGTAYIEGTLSLVVLIEGVGTISTKTHSTYIDFSI